MSKQTYTTEQLDQLVALAFSANDTFAKQYLEKATQVTGTVVSARGFYKVDNMDNDFNGKKNQHKGDYELHLEIIIDVDGIETIVDKKLTYLIPFSKGDEEAVAQYKNRISNLIIGCSKQWGVKGSELVMKLDKFCELMVGKTLTAAKAPYEVTKKVLGKEETTVYYVLEFDPDKIAKAFAVKEDKEVQ